MPTELTPAKLDAIRSRHDVPGVFRLPRREDGFGVQGHRVLMEFDGDLWVVLDANTHHPSAGKITAAAASSFADIPALLSHIDALAAKAAHAESRWQKDAMQIDADMDDLREERDEALAKVATLQSLCDSLNAKVARLEGELGFVRSLVAVGVDTSNDAIILRQARPGDKDAVLFGDIIDKLIDKILEDSSHVAPND